MFERKVVIVFSAAIIILFILHVWYGVSKPIIKKWIGPGNWRDLYRSEDEIPLNTSWRTMAKNYKLDCFSKSESKWKSPFFFIHGTDLQLGLMMGSNFNLSELGRNLVNKVNQMKPKPKFFVSSGDCCHAYPGNSVRARQESDYKKIFEELDHDIPMITVSGNHDVGDHLSQENVNMYRTSFGDDYFSFDYGGLHFLVINTQYFLNPSRVPDLAEKHKKWLIEELENSTKDRVRIIVFQHVPWFLQDPDEGPDINTIEPSIRKLWLERFKNAGVVHVYAGHLHYNAGGTYKGMPVTVTTAMGVQFGKDQSGLRIVKVYEKEVQDTFYKLDDLPTQVVL